jgi:hypothetical protein
MLFQGGTRHLGSLDSSLFNKYLGGFRGIAMATVVATTSLEAPGPATSDDVDWLVPFALIVAVEILLARTVELSVNYSLLAFTGAGAFAIGWLLLWLVRSFRIKLEHPVAALAAILWANRSRLLCTVIGIEVAALGISAFSVLKAQMPIAVPFYADRALADFDLWLFGQDAWQWSAKYFGFLIYPVSIIYGTWLMTQYALFTVVVMLKPSQLKSQAIISYWLMWLLLGIFLAYACSSVGPVFYDRLYGGQRFADLEELLRSTFAVTGTADYLWAGYMAGDFSVGGGISAMPSLHLAGTLWLALIIRRAWPRLALIGWAYLAVIYLGSIMLGWHYATDGLAGMIGMVLIWRLAGHITGWRHGPVLGRLTARPFSRAVR